VGFHENTQNLILVKNLKQLALKDKSRIFLPLCGKTLAIKYLLSMGYRIVGVEFVETAIIKLFAELKIKAEIFTINKILVCRAKNIDIFVGDIFDRLKEDLGEVDGIYDRAALLALDEKRRKSYAKHLIYLSNNAPILLLTFVYQQNLMQGPPFSVDKIEVFKHYEKAYSIKRLDKDDVLGKKFSKIECMLT